MTTLNSSQTKVEDASTEELLKEYSQGLRDCHQRIFGNNACIHQNAVAGVLLGRGVTILPNIFGDIAIHAEWSH